MIRHVALAITFLSTSHISQAQNASPIDPDYFATLQSERVESNPLVLWQHFGPGMSGYIDMFWINNGDPDAMYTALDMGNSQVTHNGGEFWRSMRDSDGVGYHPDYFVAMDFSHTDPDFGLAIRRNPKRNRGELHVTTDRGASWSYLTDPIPGSRDRHSTIAVDPSNDNNWYIGGGGGALIKAIHYTHTGIKNTSPWNIYFTEGVILYSKDKGATWTEVTAPFESDASFSAIVVDPRDSNKVYASCQYGVYQSPDGGANWSKVPGNGLPHNKPRYMDSFYDPLTQEFLLYIVEITHYEPNGDSIATTGGVYRSADGGTNWENLTGDLAIDLKQITQSGYIDKYYRAIAYWLEIETSEARDLYPNLPTNTFSQFHQIAVDPTNKDRVYIIHNFKHDYSFPPGNIWMTENGGQNWYAAAREGSYWINGVDADYWNSRAIQPTGMNATFAHVDHEHRSHDNTQTGPRFVKVNQLGHIYTAFAQQVMRSTDYGENWIQVDDYETSPGSGHWVGRGNSNLPGETFFLETGTPGKYLWGSGEHGVWRNTDDGDLVYPGAIALEQLTGQSIRRYDTTSISSIAVDPNNPERIYTLQFRQSNRQRLRYSPDNGITWQTLSEPFPAMDIRSHSLMVDHEDPDTLYFTIPVSFWSAYGGNGAFRRNGPADFTNHGVYKSTDGGRSWTRPNNGIPAGSSVLHLEMAPQDSSILYAALNESHTGVRGGLYKTTDGGAHWSAITVPNGVRSVNDVMVHKTSGNLYIACGLRDEDGSTGGAYVSDDGGASWTLIFDMPYVRGVDASAVNEDVIAIFAGQDVDIDDLNSGCYVTIDRAQNWHKINSRHGQPEKISELKTDPHDENILWCALSGTGFWHADISPLSTGIGKLNFWDWMSQNNLSIQELDQDPDQDGLTNRQEFIVNTDPNSRIHYFDANISSNPSGGVSIRFPTIPGRNYTIEKSSTLPDQWSDFANGMTGTGQSMEIVDSVGTSKCFYRVKAEM